MNVLRALIPFLLLAIVLAGNGMILWKMGLAAWLKVFFFQIGAIIALTLYDQLDRHPLDSETGNLGLCVLLLIGAIWTFYMAVRRTPQAPT